MAIDVADGNVEGAVEEFGEAFKADGTLAAEGFGKGGEAGDVGEEENGVEAIAVGNLGVGGGQAMLEKFGEVGGQ